MPDRPGIGDRLVLVDAHDRIPLLVELALRLDASAPLAAGQFGVGLGPAGRGTAPIDDQRDFVARPGVLVEHQVDVTGEQPRRV
ncbi:MAG: hypothetical protein L0027_04320, partial [Candidatus Rokubacteria bacterium]|nr:hypothetical protein [Candidatus Rokubacteria bacterium]